MKICFATNNQHKLEEIRSILGPSFEILDLRSITCFEELPETGDTFESNSLQKANYVFKRYGVACFADDSGLEVQALNGEPGVYSARYAGNHRSDKDNNALVLQRLDGITNRKACFRTVITYVDAIGARSFEGLVWGSITSRERGVNGFGYDPLFIPDGYDITFAEMSSEQKNGLSHRAEAARKLAVFLSTER